MTSNLGTEGIAKEPFGFAAAKKSRSEKDEMREGVEEALKQAFRPEFLNRIDEIIVFDSLVEDDIQQIVAIIGAEVTARVAEMGVAMEITDAARDWLAEEGFDKVFGARPLRRAVQRHVENPMAKRILGGEFRSGDSVTVDREEPDDPDDPRGDRLTFTLSERPEAPQGKIEESEPTPVIG